MYVKNNSFFVGVWDVADNSHIGMEDYQAERRVRVHLERRLVEMTQVSSVSRGGVEFVLIVCS